MNGETTDESNVKPPESFLTNVLWNWAGIGVQLLAGLVVSPYIIVKLGTERYGIWALVFSLTSYYGFLDLGFRSAVVRFAAHYRAQDDHDKINELINTTFCYLSLASVLLVGVTLVLWKYADKIFHPSPAYREEFASLVLTVGISLAVGLSMSVFSGAVEGFQRFDVSNRIRIVIFGLRGAGWFGLLVAGFGLVALGWWNLVSNILFFSIYYFWFRSIFPPFELSLRWVRRTMFRKTIGYGMHTFVAGLGTRSIDQTPSLLIGHMRSIAEVGYYNFPLRLLQYAAYGVTNVGVVALPHSATLAAKGQLEKVARLGIYANRYCLALYMPFAVFLTVYGKQLFHVWLKKPDFVTQSAPLLPVMVAGSGLALAAQFCSSSILFGMARQRGYAYAVLVEAVISIPILILALPRYGVLGAAVAGMTLMTLTRGLFTPWLLCRHLRFPFPVYMRSIFVRPVAVALPVLIGLYAAQRSVAAGQNWGELIAAGAGASLLYFTAAYFTCLEPHHRQVLKGYVRNWRQLAARGFSEQMMP